MQKINRKIKTPILVVLALLLLTLVLLVFVPRKKFMDKPAMIVELKWDKTAKGAINQIKNKQYFESLKEYQGNLLLVGINYDKQTREHQCVIEEFQK